MTHPKRRPPPRDEPRERRPPQPDGARLAALDLLTAVREDGAYANLALPRIIAARALFGRDAALATDLSYGSCRALGLLDAIIGRCSDRPLDTLDGAVHDALRLGTYQLLRTRIPPHAAVSTTVELVLAGPRPGAAGFVNAVLRKVAEHDENSWVRRIAPPRAVDPVGHLAVATSHPRWIVQALDDALGDRTGRARGGVAGRRRAAEGPPGRPTRPYRPRRLLAEIGVTAGPAPGRQPRGRLLAVRGVSGRGRPGRIPAVVDGRAAVQDEGSQLVALALAAAPIDGPDSRWLDLAAGPGGKAALLGALATRRGADLDAVEVGPHRAELVRQTVARPAGRRARRRRPRSRPGRRRFDRVLLDAPCTGLGALRRRPEARWRRSRPTSTTWCTLQRELLASAAGLVRPGGVVAYVTCSPHLAETAGVIGTRPARASRCSTPGRTCPACRTSARARRCSSGRTGTAPTAMFLALIRRDRG